ncbi:MAG: hypothetical protein WBM87_03585 [Woeseiaceae bacterium]
MSTRSKRAEYLPIDLADLVIPGRALKKVFILLTLVGGKKLRAICVEHVGASLAVCVAIRPETNIGH